MISRLYSYQRYGKVSAHDYSAAAAFTCFTHGYLVTSLHFNSFDYSWNLYVSNVKLVKSAFATRILQPLIGCNGCKAQDIQTHAVLPFCFFLSIKIYCMLRRNLSSRAVDGLIIMVSYTSQCKHHFFISICSPPIS